MASVFHHIPAGAGYTLKHDDHVRLDLVYRSRFMSDYRRAWINLACSLLFLIPFCVLIIISSWPFVIQAYQFSEGSPDPGGLPFRWVLKASIPLGFFLLIHPGRQREPEKPVLHPDPEISLGDAPSPVLFRFLHAPMTVWIALMFLSLMLMLMLGYPVAFTLGAIALLFGGVFLGFDFFHLLPLRIWGVMTNFTLLAVPLFIFMGIVLDKSGLAEDLLETMGLLFGRLRGGLAVSVVIVGALLAATTGVVGATVVTMGIIALPTMLRRNYSRQLSTGTIAAAGTLGQIIPPSIVLILLGDVMGVPVGRLFIGAVVPGVLLVVLFLVYISVYAWLKPEAAPAITSESDEHILRKVFLTLLPPLVLVVGVLGSIFFGIASPTESAAVGALGALVLAALHRQLTLDRLREAMQLTTRLTSMVFLILIGATAFGLVFRGMGGGDLVLEVMTNLPGGTLGFLIASMILIFLLGFFLDFLQICFIVVPILAPIASAMGVDLLWLAVLIAINLQTSFLTPPFGFSLFYLKAVAPKHDPHPAHLPGYHPVHIHTGRHHHPAVPVPHPGHLAA